MPVSLTQRENQPKIQHPPSVHVEIIFMKDADFCYMVNLHILIWHCKKYINIANLNEQREKSLWKLILKIC